VPPPSPPFVLPPPERSAWLIKVTRSAQTEGAQDDQDARKARDVVAISSLRYAESKRDIVSYSDGFKKEVWFVSGNVFWLYPDGSTVGVSSENLDALMNEPVTSDRFPGLNWLNADTYEGIAKIGGQECRYYTSGGEEDRREAWIGLESQLPVAAKFGEVVHSYSFTTPPDAPPQMPAMYAKALEDVKKQAARAAALAEKFRRR
jgi:hypothetical protein